MRCKPGDLAIITFAHNPKNLGRIVRVTELWGGREYHNGIRWGTRVVKMADWVIETEGAPLIASGINVPTRSAPAMDSQLRPLRGNEALTEISFPEESVA